ncbi:hypothetical protein [Isoptericola sp. 178]|uniref:hypothetical protein n=1 Tax=Isoptericola sp. 178 TaxID=3064651 RepID=UPI002714183A|nr:hypothetical protein [Isoptericola sp. 178]MDO8145192.1 hypothetical protein [Isoptericola sp. 178]
MPSNEDPLPQGVPSAVAERVGEVRRPATDPTLGVPVAVTGTKGTPPHRLVAIGDSLTHGFQSGAIFNTDLSWPAIVAHELGWSGLRYPRYGGPGGLPINIELLLRDLEHRFGPTLSLWELPLALFRARQLMDEIEDYWERGPGAHPTEVAGAMHVLGIYGWDLRDALSKTAASCRRAIGEPRDALLSQIVENNGERAALLVYPMAEADQDKTVFDVARDLGEDHDDSAESGIETLVVFLGSNNALQSVTKLDVTWSDKDFKDLRRKNRATVWRPEHFASELDEIATEVRRINARHVIWCTVPHVTIAPIARGVGGKTKPGSRYFPFYTRPWIDDATFDPHQDPSITGAEARAVDYAIDCYNDHIESVVHAARSAEGEDAKDWYLLDVGGLLDRLASRRYLTDPNARPDWWSPYPLPAPLTALAPVPDSRFLTGDGDGGRAMGGLFSLDGVHPTTIGYGVIAQEVINVMRLAGVPFGARQDPVVVDMHRLIRRDTLVRTPPQNISPSLETLRWADETLDWVKRALVFKA